MLAAILTVTSSLATADVVVLEARQDATLIEDPNGSLANGSGPAFFVGRTAQTQNSIRRGVILFDVAGSLPDQALVDGVSLELHLLPSNPAPRAIRLHRVLAPWGEGPSSSSGGGGAPSQIGDVTWLHTFFDSEYWVESGGQFMGRASAEAIVADFGPYIWESTDHMLQDVRLWNHAPAMNFGWILLGDETVGQTAKGFASRENADPELRPLLRISYHLPGNLQAP